MEFVGEARTLTEADFERAAANVGCDVAAIKAVSEVESRGGGFLRDKRPKILFEAHIFSRMTDHAFDRKHKNISSRRWNRALYGAGGAHQYKRLGEAIALDRNAALGSASWGMFQIMGFNSELCGFASISSFVTAMMESEGRHLDAMTRFVKRRRLDDELRNHDWAGFAFGYNGSGFQENRYDEKLAKAWQKHSTGAAWLTPREVQAALNRAGANPPLTVDGLAGQKTRKAIRAFQAANGLNADGKISPALMVALAAV